MIYNIPSQVIYGEDKYQEVNEIIKRSHIKQALVVSDKGLVKLGIVSKVVDQLNLEKYIIEDGVMPNPKDVYIEAVCKTHKDHEIDAIIAIGGGSVIDAAKAINVRLNNGGVINDYEKAPIEHGGYLLFAFPTTSGTASEVTGVSVITHSVEKRKMVILGEHVKADYAVLDPSLTYNLPKHITASTSMDALTHAIEAYVSTLSTSFTDAHALFAIKSICDGLKNYDTHESREQLMYASTMAGFAFNNAILGLVHGIAHPLGAHFDVPHGVANAMMLPEVVKFNYSSSSKFKAIEETLNVDDLSKYLAKLNEILGIPKLSDFIKPSNFDLIAQETLLEPSLHMNPRSVTKDDVLSILASTYNQ